MTIKIIARSFALGAAVLFGILGCQKSNQTTTESDLLARGFKSEEIRVLNNTLRVLGPNGEPVQEARILIGYAPGDPFEGNQFTTDDKGYFTIPAQWKASLPVTIEADGYTKTTFDSVEPFSQDFQLSRADGDQNLKVSGETTEFQNIRRDGKVDFGLVIPAFSRNDLLRFDLSHVISPENDEIRIIGQSIMIPSNLTLPRQRESYIFPIEFNKPVYRLFTRQPGTYRLVANHGQFPLKRVVDKIRDGESIFDVFNDFTFLEAGVREIQIVDGEVQADIGVNAMPFDAEFEIQAPAYGSDKIVFGLSAVEQDGLLFPADLKVLSPQQKLGLRVPSTGAHYKVALLTHRSESLLDVQKWERLFQNPGQDALFLPMFMKAAAQSPNFQQMSISLQSAQDSRPVQFLPLVQAPQVEDGRIRVTPPEALPGIRPVATYIILSEVETLEGGEITSERRTRLWELLSTSWVDRVELPEFQLEKKPNRTYRWEVLFLGQDTEAPSSRAFPVSLEDVTHITRNAVDFE